MKFCFFTLGCKVNLFESQALMQLAQVRGHEIVERDADAVVINTCTVTAVADHKNLRAFHKLRRDNPQAVIAACGCFAQTDPEKVRASGEIDLVCGTQNRGAVIEQLEQAVQGRQTSVAESSTSAAFEMLPAGVPRGRTRALLKIQDGCDNFCTYCIIPYARGRVRSMPAEQVVAQCERLQQAQVHEIVLTGIELSAYGQDWGGQTGLTDLLVQLLPQFPQMRFRLGSLDPRTANKAFCRRLSELDNLMPHFHLSLQSGSNSVLRRMNRHYTAEEYYDTVMRLQRAFPRCSITTDLIAGFPQETVAEWEESLHFLQRCAFADVHVFPYSARPGTKAADFTGQIPITERAARATQAKAVAAALNEQYRTQFVGASVQALAEHRTKDGYWAAHSRYSFPIYISGTVKKNQLLTVRLTDLYRDGLIAEKTEA